MYSTLSKHDNQIQELCWKYAEDFEKWRVFTENISKIKSTYESYICDYEKSMTVCKDVSFPCDSVYAESEKTLPIDDWIWTRCDNESDFSFDSEAERKWAQLLYKISSASIAETRADGLDFVEEKFLWGKNFPFNSEIKFEYYLNGVHSSYPDFVMKDKNGKIHIFEVKSVNKSASINIDEKEYEEKVQALKKCYKECSKKTGHIFYLPILDGGTWKITKLENGEESVISELEFKASVKQSVRFEDITNLGELKIATP